MIVRRWAFSATVALSNGLAPAAVPPEVTLTGTQSVVACSPAPAQDSIARKVDEALARYVALDVFSGTVLLARGDTVLAIRAYGCADRERGIPATAGTQYRIASISKALTTTAIAQLIDEGRLTPETPLATFLPRYPRSQEITVRHLVTHSSGVPHINDLPWYEDASRTHHTVEELIDRFIDTPLDFDPGTARSYSNGGYVLLAWIIEAVSGLPYGEFMRRNVFEPFGMTFTLHELTAGPPEGLAQGYTIGVDGIEAAVDADMSIKVGGGSIVSTVGDLFRWDRTLRKGSVMPQTLAMFWQPRQAKRPSYYWTGHSPGFTTHFERFLDEDVTVIVLSNNYARLNDEIAQALAAIAFDEVYQPRIDDLMDDGRLRVVPLPSPSSTQPFVGRWLQHGPGAELTFDLEADGQGLVYVSGNRAERHRLVAVAPNTFWSALLWGLLRFEAGEGTVTAARWDWLDFDGFTTAVERQR